MERVSLKSSDVNLSRLVYGMWRLGDDSDTTPTHIQAKIESCLAQGITTFDQADIYGGYRCEALGATLKAAPSLRDQMQIITKCDINLLMPQFPHRRVKHYDTSADHINASVDASLAHMGTDYIDILLIHRPDPLMDHRETGRALDALVDAGKVCAIGVSNFSPMDWQLLQSAMKASLVTNQIEISVAHNDPFVDGSVAFLQKEGIPPMAWSPLGGGKMLTPSNESEQRLSSALQAMANEHAVDAADIAIAWLLRHPSKVLPVLGTNNLERIAKLSRACTVSMSREEWFVLLQAATGKEVP